MKFKILTRPGPAGVVVVLVDDKCLANLDVRFFIDSTIPMLCGTVFECPEWVPKYYYVLRHALGLVGKGDMDLVKLGLWPPRSGLYIERRLILNEGLGSVA